MQGLLFQFLDEALNSFHAEPCFVAKRVEVLRLDKEKFEVTLLLPNKQFQKHISR